MEGTNGLMGVFMRGLGRTINCMGKVSIHGLMAESTMVFMWKTRNKGLALTSGLMAVSMKDIGIMVNNMERGSL